MFPRLRISTFFSIFCLCFLVYYAVLGNTGYLERQHLESRLKNLTEEVERLETENQNLLTRVGRSKDPSLNVDFFLAPEMARIIKFKEFVEVEGEDKILTTHVPLAIFRNKQSRNQNSSLQFLKFFYLTAIFALGLVYIIKIKQK